MDGIERKDETKDKRKLRILTGKQHPHKKAQVVTKNVNTEIWVIVA